MAVPAPLPALQAPSGLRCNAISKHGRHPNPVSSNRVGVFLLLFFVRIFFFFPPVQVRGRALRDAQEIDPGQGAQARGEGACGRSACLWGR